MDLKYTIGVLFILWVRDMDLLKERILKDGKVVGDDILKVDSFLNHQIDTELLCEIGKEFYRLFKEQKINKILTIEASGIGIACAAAQHFTVPVVFAKKGNHKNLSPDKYTTKVYSFTKGVYYDVTVDKQYLTTDDRVLIIDDFLANGNAALGLIDLANKAGAKVEGVGIVIEKGFQEGGRKIRDLGIRLESLAVVKSLGQGKFELA